MMMMKAASLLHWYGQEQWKLSGGGRVMVGSRMVEVAEKEGSSGNFELNEYGVPKYTKLME